MKKITLPLLLSLVTMPAFAETTAPDIAAGAESASCDSGTLNTTSGESTLSAQWTANVIDLTWYNGDVAYSTNSCTYDGGITLPSGEPTRTGYNFAGWKVRKPFALSDYYVNESPNWDGAHFSWVPLVSWGLKASDDFYGAADTSGLSTGEWRVKFSTGTLKGLAKCSSSDSGVPSDAQGGYCWCGSQSFDIDSKGTYTDVDPNVWMLYGNSGSYDDCAWNCSRLCVFQLSQNASFRSGLFGVTE